MKTYCKNVDFANEEFINKHINAFINERLDNANVAKLFAWYNNISHNKARKLINENPQFTVKTIDQIAWDMQWHLNTRTVREHILMTNPNETIMRYVPIIDGISKKHRELGIEKLIFQLYEVVFREAAAPLFEAKVGVFQVAAIKGKGQSFGKRHMVRWLERDPDGTKFIWKGDVKKCYPSIDHGKLRALLHRDLHKNDLLVYLANTMLDMYEEGERELGRPDTKKGLLIGSPAAKDLCNYYMSYLYHYASERLAIEKTRRGKTQRTRLISHIMIYADDIVITSPNKKYLGMAIKELIRYAEDFLLLKIKDSWSKWRFCYVGKDGKQHGNTLDYIGLVFRTTGSSVRFYGPKKVTLRKVVVTIRGSIFLKARRKMLRFAKAIRYRKQILQKTAQSFMSYNGWIVNNNTFHFQAQMKWKQITKIGSRIIGRYAKEKPYETEYYHKKWRKLYA